MKTGAASLLIATCNCVVQSSRSSGQRISPGMVSMAHDGSPIDSWAAQSKKLTISSPINSVGPKIVKPIILQTWLTRLKVEWGRGLLVTRFYQEKKRKRKLLFCQILMMCRPNPSNFAARESVLGLRRTWTMRERPMRVAQPRVNRPRLKCRYILVK